MAEAPDVSDSDSHRPRLAPVLRRAWYGLNQTFRRRIAEHGITPDQFTILRWLSENQAGMTQRSLADAMASDPNTITAILSRMLKANLIKRHSDPNDARCNRIRLTSKGKKLHATLQPLANELQEELLSHIPEKGREEFLRHLHTLAEQLEKMGEE
jgi:DNA-binding MarR family transcriptional regulator